MAKYKSSNPNQIEYVAIDYSKQLTVDSFEHTLKYLFENRISLTDFDSYFKNDSNGAPAYHPRVLLKVILFGYSRGILSSRDIARACEENILFKTLAEGFTPHFTHIAKFIYCYENEIIKIFRSVLLICGELDLIGGEFLAADGCKLRSNASKEWSGKFSDLEKKESKIRETIEYLIKKHKNNDFTISKIDLKNKIRKLNHKADKIKEFLEANEKKMGSRGREIQSNITDNESARIMGPHGIIQGYNGLAMSDSKNQVIIHAEACAGVNEGQFLTDFFSDAKAKLLEDKLWKKHFKKSMFIADTGFFSEDNCKYFIDQKIDAYIPDQHFRKRDPRFLDRDRFKKPKKDQRFTLKDFKFNKKNNEYICPNDKVLRFQGNKVLGNTAGPLYISSKMKCLNCSLRKQCLKSEKTKYRTLYISKPKHGWNYSKKMKEKIDTPEGRNIYSKRMGIIEPVFGNICYAKKMNRFNYRTKQKVNCQWLLYSMVHNIGKIKNAMA